MKRHALALIAGVLIITVLAGPALAQEDPLTVEEAFDMPLEELLTVEIATGTPRSLAEAPAITTVVTAEEIRAMGWTDLDQVLASVPGLHVSISPLRYDPVYVMRGLYSEVGPWVLIMVNGIPMTQYVSGNATDIRGGLPLEAVAKVEVLRGPGSAVFGADAVAGVINIVTKTAAEIDGTEAGLRVGSFDSREAWLLHGGRHGGFDVAFAAEVGTTEGPRELVTFDAQTGLDAAFGTSASRAPGPISAGHDRVDVHLDLGRGAWRLRAGFEGRFNVGMGAGVIQALDPEGQNERRRLSADLGWQRELGSGWSANVLLSTLDTALDAEFNAFPPGSFNGVDFLPEGQQTVLRLSDRQVRLQAVATWEREKEHRLRLGAGFHHIVFDIVREARNFSPDGRRLPGGLTDVTGVVGLTLGPDRSRDDRYLFVQDEWRLSPAWEATLGLRWDDYSDFGDTLNPRLALVWKGSPRTTAKLLFGRAFRAPSYREQHLANNPLIRGNPELAPEVLNSLELGLTHEVRSDLRLAVNLFAYRLKDIILPGGPPPSVYQNFGTRRGRGLEVEARWQPGERLELVSSYAFQHSDDELSDNHVGHAPGHQLDLRTVWRFRDGWSWSATADVAADRLREAGDPRPRIGDDVAVAMTLRREGLAGGLDVALVARNVFDADLREPSPFVPGPVVRYIPDDLPLAGASVALELRWRLGGEGPRGRVK